MKVELTPTITNQKLNLLTKVKRFFLGKTKPIPNDTFEKKAAAKAEMEAYDKRRIVSRKHPNWCDAPEDGYWNNTIARTRCYYPEDIEKMKSMTEDEAILYKRKLYKIGRFYYGETLTKQEHESFLRSLGLDPEEYYIRDNK